MATVRFSIVTVLHTIRLCVDRLDADFSFCTRWSDVQCDFCGLHAGIDLASPAVLLLKQACGSTFLSIPFSLAVDIGRSHSDDNTFRVL